MSPRDSKGQGRSCDAGERVLTDKDLIAGHGDRVDVEHRDAGGAQGALDGGRDPRPGERQVAGIEGERPRRRGERPQRREVERVQRRSARPAPPTSTASTATDRDTPDDTRLMRRPPSSIAPTLSQLNVAEANFLGGGSQGISAHVDLRHWLADKLAALQAEALNRGEPIPAKLPGDTPVFDVPTGLIRIFNRDLTAAAKIAKKDDRGRTLDVHALRTTFGTLLSRGGVPLRTAQAAMRHSDPSLTANIYTDARLLDVHGALDALPSLPLSQVPTPTGSASRQRIQALMARRPLHCPLHYLTTNGEKRWSVLTKRRAPTMLRPGLTQLSQLVSLERQRLYRQALT